MGIENTMISLVNSYFRSFLVICQGSRHVVIPHQGGSALLLSREGDSWEERHFMVGRARGDEIERAMSVVFLATDMQSTTLTPCMYHHYSFRSLQRTAT